MTNTTKNILIAVAVILIIFISFKLFVPKKDINTENALEISELSNNSGVVLITPTKKPTITLTKLKTIKINKELFSEKTFISLEDFTIKIIPETVGRNNPFAPVDVN